MYGSAGGVAFAGGTGDIFATPDTWVRLAFSSGLQANGTACAALAFTAAGSGLGMIWSMGLAAIGLNLLRGLVGCCLLSGFASVACAGAWGGLLVAVGWLLAVSGRLGLGMRAFLVAEHSVSSVLTVGRKVGLCAGTRLAPCNSTDGNE